MPEPAAQLYRVQLLNWHFTVKLSKLFLLFFSLFYQFNINIFPWHCLCGAAGTETWAIGTETKMIWKGNKIINRKYLKFEELAFPFKHLALGWQLPKVQGRGQQDSPLGGTDATSPLLCLVPRTPPPGVQQSHSPTCTQSLSRCPNHGSKAKTSPRNISFCSLHHAPKLSRHIQRLNKDVLLQSSVEVTSAQ